MPFNICWFGGDITGVLDSSQALNNALAALPTGGGQIYFPGKFKFLSAINYTIPSGRFSVSFVGVGADATNLYWPSTNGITINASSFSHSVHFRDITISCGSSELYAGVTLNQTVCLGIIEQSDFIRVTFQGNDLVPVSSWLSAISVFGLSNISYDTCIFYGNNGATTGINLSGNTSNSPYYSIIHNIYKCGFFNCGIGIEYGTYVQGVTVSQSNFSNGVTGIHIPTGANGATQLTVIASQFNCTENQILLQGAIASLMIQGNLMYITADFAGITCLSSSGSIGASITANQFYGTSLTASYGVYVGGTFTNGTVTGNIFSALAAGVNLLDASGWNVQANVYPGCTSTVVNIGGNTVGTATQ